MTCIKVLYGFMLDSVEFIEQFYPEENPQDDPQIANELCDTFEEYDGNGWDTESKFEKRHVLYLEKVNEFKDESVKRKAKVRPYKFILGIYIDKLYSDSVHAVDLCSYIEARKRAQEGVNKLASLPFFSSKSPMVYMVPEE